MPRTVLNNDITAAQSNGFTLLELKAEFTFQDNDVVNRGSGMKAGSSRIKRIGQPRKFSCLLCAGGLMIY